MKVVMENCLVLDTFQGKSQKGRDYGRLKFLDADYNVWELFVGGSSLDVLSALRVKAKYNLTFELKPGFNGGSSLDLVG